MDIRTHAQSTRVYVIISPVHIASDEPRPLPRRGAEHAIAPLADGINDGVGLSAT